MKDNIFALYSTSFRLLEEEIEKITGGNSYTTYNLDEMEIDDVLNDASYYTLFDDKNYMVVKNVTNFSANKKGKESSNKDDYLLNYLNEPNDNTVLILVLKEKLNATKKISKIVKDKYNYVELNNPNQKESRNIINKFLQKNKISIDYDGITYIINSLDNNYDLIMNELEKLLLFDKKDISFKDLTNIISSNVLDNNFKFIEYIMNKDIKKVFKYYDDFLLNKNSPIMLMSMLANEYRNVYLVKKLMMNNNKNDIMKKLDIRFSFQIDKLINYSYSYKEKDLENKLLELCNLDYEIKQGNITDKLALELFLLKACE